jgi:hypothetical protein
MIIKLVTLLFRQHNQGVFLSSLQTEAQIYLNFDGLANCEEHLA